MTNYTCFDLEVKDHIAHLSMSRPDALNAMTRIFWKELPEIIKDIDKALRNALKCVPQRPLRAARRAMVNALKRA